LKNYQIICKSFLVGAYLHNKNDNNYNNNGFRFFLILTKATLVLGSWYHTIERIGENKGTGEKELEEKTEIGKNV
jgi:hypothetical protein